MVLFHECHPISLMLARGNLKALNVGLRSVISFYTNRHTRTQCYVSGAVINQQFDLPGQTEKCPYKGSSIGTKLHTGGMQQDRGGAVCCVCSNRKMGCAHTHTHKETHIHYANYELCTGGKLSREVTVKGDSYAGDSWFSL